ncbi:MAG: TolC family protein [Bacteroidales bacterium]|nr:TolC family protein [Bacteroidales bacterium]
MKGTKIYLVLTLMIARSFVYSQDKAYMLTLEEACEYALQYNKTLLNARDQVTVSDKKIFETIANGLPQVEGSLDYMTYFNYELALDFGSSSGADLPDFTQPPYDMGDAALFGDIMGLMGSSEPIILNDQFSGKIQVSQLIFSGQYIAGIQTAKIARKMADQSITKSELDIKEGVSNTYYTILITEKTLTILGENLDNLELIMQNTSNLYNVGVAEETDVDRLKMTVNELKNTEKSLERMNQLNYNMLKFQLGVAPETEIVLADSLSQIIEKINLEHALADSFDVSNNINYQLMESQVKLTSKQVDMQKWAYTPTIAGFYNYTEKFITTSFDMNPNHLAGFTVSVPIFSSGIRNSRVAQAKINLDIARRNQEMLKDQLETQNKQLLFNYQSALENYRTQKENVAIAERVYLRVKNKYQQGLVSSFELTQENSNYLSAESNYLSAVLTLLQAQISLDKLYNK